MMKKDKSEIKILYALRFHSEMLDYLKAKAKEEFTTVTQYIIDLIAIDKKNKENGSVKDLY